MQAKCRRSTVAMTCNGKGSSPGGQRATQLGCDSARGLDLLQVIVVAVVVLVVVAAAVVVVAVWYSRLLDLYLLQLGAQLRETVKEEKVRQQAKASKETCF